MEKNINIYSNHDCYFCTLKEIIFLIFFWEGKILKNELPNNNAELMLSDIFS